MINRETLRIQMNELEELLRERRPHDGFTLRIGLPKNGKFLLVGSHAMRQTTLDEFGDLGEEIPLPPPAKNYEFHLTVHPQALDSECLRDTLEHILALIKTNYPRQDW
jgi:hypothetical protein